MDELARRFPNGSLVTDIRRPGSRGTSQGFFGFGGITVLWETGRQELYNVLQGNNLRLITELRPPMEIREGSWVRNAHDTRMRGIVRRIENASAHVQWGVDPELQRHYLRSLISDPDPTPMTGILFPIGTMVMYRNMQCSVVNYNPATKIYTLNPNGPGGAGAAMVNANESFIYIPVADAGFGHVVAVNSIVVMKHGHANSGEYGVVTYVSPNQIACNVTLENGTILNTRTEWVQYVGNSRAPPGPAPPGPAPPAPPGPAPPAPATPPAPPRPPAPGAVRNQNKDLYEIAAILIGQRTPQQAAQDAERAFPQGRGGKKYRRRQKTKKTRVK